MGRRKKLEVKREFGTPIQEFVETGKVYVPQSVRDKKNGLSSKPSPLDDSEIVQSEASEINSKIEKEYEELQEKYSSLLDERDEWKKKCEELEKKQIPAPISVDNSFEIQKIKSEYDLKESLLMAKIENLQNELKEMSEKARRNSVNPPPPQPGFSSGMIASSPKKMLNGYESW